MSEFKKWYEEKYKVPYPGHPHETSINVVSRLADAIATYLDEKFSIKEKKNIADE